MSVALRASVLCLSMLTVTQITVVDACAQEVQESTGQAIAVQEPVTATAAFAETWARGDTTITALRGGSGTSRVAMLRQGDQKLSAESIVVFDTKTDQGHKISVYAEGQVIMRQRDLTRNHVLHTLHLESSVPLKADTSSNAETEVPSELMKRAVNRLYPKSRPLISTASAQITPDIFLPPEGNTTPQLVLPASRRIRVRPRSSAPLQFESSVSRDTVPEEQVYVFTGGVNVLVDGVELEDFGGQFAKPGVLDLSADRVVVWTQPSDGQGLDKSGGTLVQSSNSRLQIYLEGNILVRQQQNTVTASHAFYDANNDRALLINAELRAFLPQTGGEVRVRAERLRQTSRNRFHAQNAWTTTSPYGKPGYRLQASDIFVEPGPISPFTQLDQNGQPVNGQPLWITSLNTKFIVGDVPLLWLPRTTVPAEDPNIPIRRASVKHDQIFGLQVKTVWNLTKILGQPKQKGMQWDLLADYMTDRGPAIGVQGNYDVMSAVGRARGMASVLYQYDDGTDNLGEDRRELIPEYNSRGQAIWRHKQDLPTGSLVFGEIGFVSDRNYRESFDEQTYDTDKDAETLAGIRHDYDAWSGTLWAKTELNEFEASTDWLPRADLYSFSQPLFNGLAYWSSHSSVGYADLELGKPPSDPNDPYTPLALPYYSDSSGLVAMTRHQVDAPFMLGPVNINPFVMGEAAFWEEGLLAEDIDRYLLSTGVQAHLSATRVMPFVRSDLWNLNGLAHKVDNFVEWQYTDSSRNLNEISQYNQIDDNAQERFRTRYTTQIYPGLIPPEFDPRFYAVRNGAGLWTSAPYHELAADQQVLRLRSRHRWQTKVGPMGAERIRDWMIFETGVTFFPDAMRDNFGEDFGLLYGNYRWNISDRTSVLADGIFDFFENSQDVWSVGLLSQRSLRGSMYLGYRKVQAADYLDSQTLVASYSYQMSPKWISTGSIAHDIADGMSRGASLTFSRVGLDWVMHFGFGIDTSKDNVGMAFALEPRFGPPSPTNLSYLLGLQR